MSGHRPYSTIYHVQRNILLIFYTTTVVALGIPLTWAVMHLFPDHMFPLIAVLVLYMVAAIMAGSAIHVISFIPFNLANAFDPIKNDIASGKVTDVDQLGIRITKFTIEFFNFSFLDDQIMHVLPVSKNK